MLINYLTNVGSGVIFPHVGDEQIEGGSQLGALNRISAN